jgi:DNA repair photolyase
MTKIIYKPKDLSPAWEYSKYAVSLFEGCKEQPCTYCYMSAMAKRFNKYFGAARLKPALLETDIRDQFRKEIYKNLPEYQKHGIFFYFNSDPFLPQTKELTYELINICLANKIIPTTLTKHVDFIKDFVYSEYPKLINFGFTLTGHDEMEPGCAPNLKRIAALKILKEMGFSTWVSLEPIISWGSSLNMVRLSAPYVDVFKIGVQSGKKYPKGDIESLIENLLYSDVSGKAKLIFKQSMERYL